MRKITYKDTVPENLKKMVIPSFSSSNTRNSIGMEGNVGEYFFIPVEDLVPYKNQARKYFNADDLESLSQSIKEHGIRQPLTVLPLDIEKGKYEIVSGERRFRAAKIAGLEKVPCIVIHDKNKAEEIALIENIHREDLHPIELGNAYKSLLDKGFVANQLELSRKIAVKNSTISEYLHLCEIPLWAQEYLIKNNIRSRDIFRKIVKVIDDNDKLEIILGLKEEIKIKPFSVLRVSYNGQGLNIQSKGIKKLPQIEKDNLKQELKKLMNNLV